MRCSTIISFLYFYHIVNFKTKIHCMFSDALKLTAIPLTLSQFKPELLNKKAIETSQQKQTLSI